MIAPVGRPIVRAWLAWRARRQPGYLDRLGERFDTIVLDPPAFAKNKAAVTNARAGYKEINLRALKLLNRAGRSSHAAVRTTSTKPRSPTSSTTRASTRRRR